MAVQHTLNRPFQALWQLRTPLHEDIADESQEKLLTRSHFVAYDTHRHAVLFQEKTIFISDEHLQEILQQTVEILQALNIVYRVVESVYSMKRLSQRLE